MNWRPAFSIFPLCLGILLVCGTSYALAQGPLAVGEGFAVGWETEQAFQIAEEVGCELELPESQSEQEELTIQVTGFFQTDALWVHQDAANIRAVRDVQDGADFRRTRLAAQGDFGSRASYEIEFDFSLPGRPSFMDVQVILRDLPLLGNVRIGHYLQPFGMDEKTSPRELLFLERGSTFAFSPFRQIGIGTLNTSADERGTSAISVIRFPTDAFGGNIGDDGGYGMMSRFTRLLYDREQTLLHVGFDYTIIDPSNNAVRFRAFPEVFVTETPGALVPEGVPSTLPPFVDTGVIPTDRFHLFNLEAAAQHGSWYLQSEVRYAHVKRSGASAVTFPGAYIQTAYVLTGETHPYDRNNAVFDRVRPEHSFLDGGPGAWEIAGRWSYLNLNAPGIPGGQLNNFTLGVNWYLHPRIKFQANYIYSLLSDPSEGDTIANFVALRAQADF